MRNGITMLIAFCFAVCMFPTFGQAQQNRTQERYKVGIQKRLQQKRQAAWQRNGRKMLESLKGDLALSSEQKSELKSLRYDFQRARIEQQADVKMAILELRHLKRDENSSEEAVLSAIDKLAETKAEMQKLQYLHRQEVQSLFSDEQLKALKEQKELQSEILQKKNWRGNKKRMRRGSGHRGI